MVLVDGLCTAVCSHAHVLSSAPQFTIGLVTMTLVIATNEGLRGNINDDDDDDDGMLFDETENEIKDADLKASDNDHRDENAGDDEPEVVMLLLLMLSMMMLNYYLCEDHHGNDHALQS